jgi:tetratricopeptide (TPR) repeat protein
MSLKDASSLIPLASTYGVYAFAILFMFYMWRRSAADVKSATPERVEFFSRVHVVVVTATIALAAAATSIWFYATFKYRPVVIARGLITGLTLHSVSPPAPGGGPRVYQDVSIDAVSDVETYKIIETRSDSQDYALRWLLASRDSFQTASFTLQHHFEALVRDNSPRVSLDQSEFKPVSKVDEKHFVIDLSHSGPTSPVSVVYVPDPASLDAAGHLFLQTQSGRAPIQWVSDARATVWQRIAVAIEHRFAPIAFAQAQMQAQRPLDLFKPNGDYEPRTGAILRQRLGGGDVQSQVATRRTLVENGTRAFKFIEDSLDPQAAKGVDRALLVHNLATIVTDSESSKNTFPRSGYLKFAQAYYDLGDYQTAAKYFDRAGGSLGSADEYLKRGYAFQEARRSDQAGSDFRTAIQQSTGLSAAVAHNALGTLYLEQKRFDDATAEFNAALRLDPRMPSAMNNQAYAYAEKGERLNDALALVTRALQVSPNNPNYLDTRGWVLFKLGKVEEAVTALESAAKQSPNDPSIQAHLAIARRQKKP